MQQIILAPSDADALATVNEELLAVLPWLTLESFRRALAAQTGYPFVLYGWKNAGGATYGVVSLDSARSLWADGKMTAQSMIGTVDLFTRDATPAPQKAVQAALATFDMAWYLNSIQYEEDSGYIHYEWIWEVA